MPQNAKMPRGAFKVISLVYCNHTKIIKQVETKILKKRELLK